MLSFLEIRFQDKHLKDPEPNKNPGKGAVKQVARLAGELGTTAPGFPDFIF